MNLKEKINNKSKIGKIAYVKCNFFNHVVTKPTSKLLTNQPNKPLNRLTNDHNNVLIL